MTILIAGTVHLPAGDREKALAETAQLVTDTRTQQGCLQYVWSADPTSATRVCVWTSTAPGRTSRPVASMTRSAVAAGPDRSASMASIAPALTAMSARRDPATVTTVPPRMTRSGVALSRRAP